MASGDPTMMAIILAGGHGTRLEPYTTWIPKPLIPLGDMPILEIAMRQLQAAGVRRIVLSLGHMSYLFTALIERWRRSGIEIDVLLEDQPLGTAGSIALVDRLEDNFLVMNGDLLTTLDYRALFAQHLATGAWATIAVARRELQVDYGVIRLSPEGELEDYLEKPVIRYQVSMGVNVVSRRAVEFIPRGSRFDIPDLMRVIRSAGERVLGYPSSAYWQDIGRPSDLQQATADFIADPGRFIPAGGAPG